MALPVETVKRPAVLSGQSNGKLPGSIMLDTPGRAGGPEVRLVEPAARAWRAMTAAAAKAGHVLKATSATDSYRPYADQERIFRNRYTTTYLAGRPTKRWQGRIWYQLPNTAVAAVPGTSNHGWALAVDIGEERDGDAGTESIDQGTVNWLVAHADEFGFSAELQSEPWHWRYFAGDAIPAAVLAYEANNDEGGIMALPAYGDKGEEVKYAQRRLFRLGYETAAIDPKTKKPVESTRFDGVFGDALHAAVNKYRTDHGVEAFDAKQSRVTGWMLEEMEAELVEKFSKPGPRGPAGDDGTNGKDGRGFVDGELVTITGAVRIG